MASNHRIPSQCHFSLSRSFERLFFIHPMKSTSPERERNHITPFDDEQKTP